MPDHTRPVWPFKEYGLLTAHPRGSWCKKVKGKLRYFGPWAVIDPDNLKAKAALQRYLDFAQAEASDTTPAVVLPTDLTLNIAVNQFLTGKIKAVEAGTLTQRQYTEYRNAGKLLLNTLGRGKLLTKLTPADFAQLRGVMEKRWGPVRLGNTITWVRSIFNHVQEYHGVVARFGGQFDRPRIREMRKASTPKKLFTQREIKALLKLASPAMRAMILLGINGGFGQMDFAMLPVGVVDFKRKAIDYTRQKTGVKRVIPAL